jgi:hypothetical protein
VWPGFGERSDDLRSHFIDGSVRGYLNKPLSGYYLGHEHWGLPFAPDFVVADHPGPVAYLGAMVVRALTSIATVWTAPSYPACTRQ